MERSLRLFLASAGMMIAASPAFAQQATIDAAKFASGVSCASAAEASAGLQAAISQSLSGSPGDVVVDLLNQLSADATTCTAVRAAAKELSTAVVDAGTTAASDQIASASGAIISATLAEADRRAASLKFKVGPPPRNMTKGREGF